MATGFFGDIYKREIPKDEQRDKVSRVKDSVRQEFFNKKGVVGLDVDHKHTKREKTTTLCVLVYVDKKLPVDKIEPHDLIPSEVDGIPTDVIESSIETRWPSNNQELYRTASKLVATTHKATVLVCSVSKPISSSIDRNTGFAFGNTNTNGQNCAKILVGGLSASNPKSNIIHGTIGLVIEFKKKPTLISCQHVFGSVWNATPPEPVLEPSVANGGTDPMDLAGSTVAGWYGPKHNADLAIADIQSTRKCQYCTIEDIGTITGESRVAIGDKVAKYGAATGYTKGTVVSINTEFTYDMPPAFPKYALKECIKVEATPDYPCFAAPGDSGSFVVIHRVDQWWVVGMVIGGNHIKPPFYAVLLPVNTINNMLRSI